jgi:tetratricopeptide (TPR) repeat protein
MTADPARVKELFIAALDLPDPQARQAFLDRECGADSELRRRLEVLLRAHDDPASALDRPLAAEGPATTAHHRQGEGVGTVLAGRYKLLEQIGEGGMGTVWVAEQTQPVRRKVALKLIKAGLSSSTVLYRFEAERQALAVMDHPNIAKVLDGGTTESGRPFFVMEYVKGIPFVRYCDDARLSIAERLALFVPVCQAVQHAHQKGIIHRDLKPSNILVCLYDGTPVPKVIDFGLAKAMHQPLTEHTLYTEHGVMVGTPLYMSPEQAELNNLDVDTRTDIYALGVILYELLTGTTPLEKQRFKEAAWHEMLRLIKDEEPPCPSARLIGSGSLPAVAAQRQLEPERLAKLVRGELDWIVMKCLEKDRARRYDTVTGLARDVERYLADEVVEARPPGAGYRLRKFARRHRGRLVATAAVLLALLAGAVVATWQRAERHRERHVTAFRARQAVQSALDQAEAALKAHKLAEVDAAISQAELRLEEAEAPDLQETLLEMKKDRAMVGELDDIFTWRWNVARGQVRLFPSKAKDLYPRAFQRYGLAIDAEQPGRIAAAIRRSRIAEALRVGLEQWFFLEPARASLREVLDADNVDRLRADIHAALAANQPERVRQLVLTAHQAVLTPAFVTAVGMSSALPREECLRLMKASWSRQPDFFPLAMALAARHTEMDVVPAGTKEEAVGWCRTAVALRPESAFAHHCLGVALGELGDQDGRLRELREAMRLAPRFERAASLLAWGILNSDKASSKPGTLDEALALYKSVVEVNPSSPAGHAGLLMIYHRQGKTVEAATEYLLLVDLLEQISEADSCFDPAGCVFAVLTQTPQCMDSLFGRQGSFSEALRRYEQAPGRSHRDARRGGGDWYYFPAGRAAVTFLAQGQGRMLPAVEQSQIRRKALEWLGAAFDGLQKRFTADRVSNAAAVHEGCEKWLSSTDLASVRDEEALVLLTADEREQWRKLWDGVRSLRDRTTPTRPTPPAGK